MVLSNLWVKEPNRKTKSILNYEVQLREFTVLNLEEESIRIIYLIFTVIGKKEDN